MTDRDGHVHVLDCADLTIEEVPCSRELLGLDVANYDTDLNLPMRYGALELYMQSRSGNVAGQVEMLPGYGWRFNGVVVSVGYRGGWMSVNGVQEMTLHAVRLNYAYFYRGHPVLRFMEPGLEVSFILNGAGEVVCHWMKGCQVHGDLRLKTELDLVMKGV